MSEVAVTIERFVDDHQPGFVECSLMDAHGTTHLFVEKIPIVTAENLSESSQYPTQGSIACTVEREWPDANGRTLAQISTELPWHIESIGGETRFVVLAYQVRDQGAA